MPTEKTEESTLLSSVILREETYEQSVDDIRGLLASHWREAGRDHSAVPMSVDWKTYEGMAHKGQLLIIAARDGRQLVGYAVWFIIPHVNYQHTPHVTSNIYFILPEYRKGGLLSRMTDLCEERALARAGGKVVRLIQRSKDPNIDAMLTRRGYVPVERSFEKLIGNSGD